MNRDDFLNSDSFHEKSHRLYDIIYKHQDIDSIIDEASRVFENSLILSDNSFSVIACTSFVDTYDPNPEDSLWEFISSNRYYPSEYTDYAFNNRLHTRLVNIEPEISKDEGFKARYYSRRIYVDEKNIGFVTLVEHLRPITEEDTYLLQEFTHVLKVALERNKIKKESSEERYSYVISELLTSRPDSTRLHNRLNYSGINPLTYLNVLIFKRMSLERDMPVEYLLRSTERFVSGGKGVVFNEDSVAFIAMRSNLEEDCITDREALYDFLKKRNIALGISYTYKNIGNSSLHVKDAEYAIEAGHRLHPGALIYDYEKYCIYSAISKSLSPDDCLSLINPHIGMIREYDRIHGTEYYDTLRAYLESNLKMTATAKAMNLHRNTVDYRISKLKESFGIDPEDQTLAMSYRISFYLFDILA